MFSLILSNFLGSSSWISRAKKSKDLKPYERFVLDVTGEYGCKDFYILKDIRDYNPEDNLVASDKPIADDDSSY